MRDCKKCGTQSADDAIFCFACGSKFMQIQPETTDRDKIKKQWFKKPWPYIALAVIAAIGVMILTGVAQDIVTFAFGEPAEPIEFDDDNFEKSIREVLGIWDEEIMTSDIKGITELNLEQKNIKNIGAIMYFTELESLDLSGNEIRSLSPLSQLMLLEHLKLEDNQISDVSPLAELTELKTLALNNNRISDISALYGLSNMQYLSLNGNQISDISALSQMTDIKELMLSDNAIESLEPLSDLVMLEKMCLNNNKIKDLQPLEHLAVLKQLELSDNRISEIAVLESCTEITDLSIQNNPVSNIDALAGLQSLSHINIEGTEVSDISAIIQEVEIGMDNPETIKLSLSPGEYFMIDNLKLPLDIGDSKIIWKSGDIEILTFKDGKVQTTNMQTCAFYEKFNKVTLLTGQIENTEITFSVEITISHDSYGLDYDDKKTTYKSGSMRTTGYTYLIEPMLENVIGVELDYDITITKGKLEKFTLRAYIDGKWKNFGEINAKETPSGRIHIDFNSPVSFSKYWVIATGKKTGSWTDYSVMSTIYYAEREADLGDLQKDADTPAEQTEDEES